MPEHPPPEPESHRIAARLFDDTIDGYFPLRQSLAQMLERNRFSAALISLLYVPVMEIPGLPPDAPVPLRLPAAHAGVISRLIVIARSGETGLQLAGQGRWHWRQRPHGSVLSPMVRLGEPVFIRGIGFEKPAPGQNTISSHSFGPMALDPHSDVAFVRVPAGAGLHRAAAQTGWTCCRAWGFGPAPEGLCYTTHDPASPARFGVPVDPWSSGLPALTEGETGAYLLVNTGTPALENRARAMAEDR